MARWLTLPGTSVEFSSATPTTNTLDSVTDRVGIAGQVLYVAITTYRGVSHETGERWVQKSATTFVGTSYGTPGPVVMILESGAQSTVEYPEDFGDTFGKEWIRRFYLRGR